MPQSGSALNLVSAEPAVMPPPGDRPRWWFGTFARLLGAVTLPVLILDQASKYYVSTHMELYQSIALIPHWLDITYTRNPGAAFSLFVNLPAGFRSAMLLALAAAAIIVLGILIARSRRADLTSIAFALVLAGALGNVIDRLIRGQVIDFIRVHYYGWSYPIFNVADSAITIGIVLVILTSFRKSPPEQQGDQIAAIKPQKDI